MGRHVSIAQGTDECDYKARPTLVLVPHLGALGFPKNHIRDPCGDVGENTGPGPQLRGVLVVPATAPSKHVTRGPKARHAWHRQQHALARITDLSNIFARRTWRTAGAPRPWACCAWTSGAGASRPCRIRHLGRERERNGVEGTDEESVVLSATTEVGDAGSGVPRARRARVSGAVMAVRLTYGAGRGATAGKRAQGAK